MRKMLGKIQNETGISLIELIVAVSIFSFVMIAASGIFINAIKTQKVIIAKQNVVDNMRYIMEFMVKEIKMAQADNINLNMTFEDGAGNSFRNSSSSAIVFTSFNGDKIKYYLLENKVLRTNITTPSLLDDDQPISSDEVLVTSLGFSINDWNLSDGPAPFLNILIKAQAKNGAGGKIDIQNSVSPRSY